MLLFTLISGTVVTTFSSTPALNLTENSWNTKTPMKQERAGLGVVTVDGKIYAIGGYTTICHFTRELDGFCGTNERYDPKTDTWVTLKAMPTPRANFAIAAHEGKIYCIGHGPTEVYDTTTNSWSTKTSIQFNGNKLKANVIDGKIFVLANLRLYMYDPNSDIWTEKASIPNLDNIPIANIEWQSNYLESISAVIDNRLMALYSYSPGGGLSPVNRVMFYDPKTDVWTEGPMYNYPAYVFGCGISVTNGLYAPKKAYFIDINGVNLVYDPVNCTWSSAETRPTYRKQFGVAAIDDTLYVIGGAPLPPYPLPPDFVDKAISVNEQYIPIGYGSVITPEPSNPTLEPTNPTPEPSNPTPETTKNSESFLNPPIVTAILALIVSVVVISLFFYFKKRKENVLAHE